MKKKDLDKMLEKELLNILDQEKEVLKHFEEAGDTEGMKNTLIRMFITEKEIENIN